MSEALAKQWEAADKAAEAKRRSARAACCVKDEALAAELTKAAERANSLTRSHTSGPAAKKRRR